MRIKTWLKRLNDLSISTINLNLDKLTKEQREEFSLLTGEIENSLGELKELFKEEEIK